MTVRLSKALMEETFKVLRECGDGRRECQALWVSAWRNPDAISRVIHPHHTAHSGGFQVEDSFINELWLDLAKSGSGVRVQVHTHPGTAFHSGTDDSWPIVHTTGFLSLVIPNFALGPVGLREAYLAQIDHEGRWREVDAAALIDMTP